MPISTHKSLTTSDITQQMTLLHEAIPITGTICSGTYASMLTQSQTNIKTYSHGLYVTVGDYPQLSASMNKLADVYIGEQSKIVVPANYGTASTRNLMYLSTTQQFVGPGNDGQIDNFNRLGLMGATASADTMYNWLALNFSRLTVKDGIKKGSFNLTLGVNDDYSNPFSTLITIFDTGSIFSGPAGEYAVLYSGSRASGMPASDQAVGLLYYQMGTAIIQPSSTVITGTFGTHIEFQPTGSISAALPAAEYWSWTGSLASATNDNMADATLRRIQNISFENNVEINSTLYTCRYEPSDFNFSSNPTFTDPTTSGIRDRQDALGIYTTEISAKTYITKVGLYDPTGKLLAQGSLSRAIENSENLGGRIVLRTDF